ncbi:MAG TPA: asparagine synthase-related protein, partial [Alphaproteobacteria bacterium]|nr:asparagine synthase-related protein [Alphaproteobacteria bacterium]
HFGVRPAAFTYRYADYEGEFNETAQARAAAEHLGLEHHEMIVGPADIAANLEAMLIAHSGPLSYGAHSAILRDVAASGAQILYNGVGGGVVYPSASEKLGHQLRRIPLPHAAIARGVERGFGTRRPWANSLAYAERVAASGLGWRFHAPLTSDSLRASLYLDPDRLDRAKRAIEQLFAGVVAEFADEDAIVRYAGPHQRLYSADGTNAWASFFGHAHRLSPRSPYLDNDYLELLYRMPRSGRKREIRELAAKLLPRELAFAPKLPQTLPIAHWLRGPMSEFITAQLSAPRIAEGGLFRHEVIMDLLRRHREGGRSHAWTLWNVLVVTLWQEIVRREAGTCPSGAVRPLGRQAVGGLEPA